MILRAAAYGMMAYAVFLIERAAQGETRQDFFGSVQSDIVEGYATMKKAITGWDMSLVPQQYAGTIAAAEQAKGIPPGMLARLLWQESRYRPDIIDGRTRSPVGALGIAQFMPATAADYGINPLDPFQAIPAAAKYLAWLRGQTNSWAEALAAYNWGIGNVQRRGLAVAPRETKVYYSSILNDLGMA